MPEPGALSPAPVFALIDLVRRTQGLALDLFGLGPCESAYRVVAAAPGWRLRDYGGAEARAPLLIVAAPIKRPYLWDLSPSVSAIRFCRDCGFRVYLLEWTRPQPEDAGAGLELYGDRAIADCVAHIRVAGATEPILLGHSLGGTLAATFAALDPQAIGGLVLLGAPVCFAPGSSLFRDAVVALAPSLLADGCLVPGSVISQLSALASPAAFIWPRFLDISPGLPDPRVATIRARVERWALDEVALPGVLVAQVLQWLYREDRLCRGTLRLRGRTIGPARVLVPTLAVVNAADAVAPAASVTPFLDRIPGGRARLLTFPGEAGLGLQHVAILVGPRTRAEVWPEIAAWLDAHG